MTNRQDKLAQLTPAQKALLLKKLAAKNLTSEPKHTVPVRAEGCLIPMTSSQQRLWFLQRYTGSSSLYNMPIFLRLQGALNRQAMEKAFAKVFERHELLRTRFYQTDEGFFQQLNAAEPFKLNAIDLADTEMQAERLQAVLQEMADYSFDLEQGELIRLRLIKLAQDEYVLATCAHHIITDGWSVNVFMRDFTAFYQSELKQEEAVLPPLPIQFADYAVWQQQVLASSAGEQDLAFWQAYLKDVPYFLELPADFKRPKTARHQGALYEFAIDGSCKQSLSALAKAQQVSVYVLLLSAFAVLLARYSGQRRLLIGTPFAGRNYKELEDLIGFFVNSLPIKAECSGKQSFIDVLQQTQQSFLAASSHQQVPFEKIVDAVQPERNESYSPLFQVMFTYINEAAHADALADLSVQLIPSARTSAKFDLTLSIEEQGRLLTGLFEYDTDLFEQAGIERMMTAYLNILTAVVSKPDVLIEQIDLLSAEDYQRIVYDWNDCRTDFPRHRTVPEQFQLQARQRPDHIALIHGERQLTYRQLNEQANQLAHLLIEHGVKAGDYVALYLQRGCDLAIAMMATLKAGAAYLPLDMAYPLERLALMHWQMDIAVTLTQQSLLANAQVFGQTEILAVDRLDKQAYSTTDPSCGHANALAYVMFTSGSTGNPKGIGITHAAINRLVLDTNYIDLNPNDRVAQANNTAFDASTFEIWGALLNGACLAIADRETSLSVTDFVGFLRAQKITVLLLTTALFNQIIRQQPDAFAGLRYVLFGGEKVDPEQVKAVLKHGKPEHFLHIYGPTESTTFASWYEINAVSDTALTVPIGWPLANTRLYVLDAQLKPVPVGVSGELYIAGDGLSPCYINQPMETAAKYVPDVFSRQPGERMYRSGDIVRWNNDGVIEFIGRVDQQVKIRGVRIELGAVETAINAYPSVQQSYVRVKDIAGQGSKCLIAYFSAIAQQVDVAGLRLHLQSALPDYMVPAALVPLPNLPLTPNGKIDEKALPEPNAEHYHQTASEPPVTDTEIKLAQLWEPLLGVQVKRDSDFFLLGGHSILVMQLANRIRNSFDVKLPIRELFEKSILREQAKAIEDSGQDVALGLKPAAKADDYPLSFSQERLYFLQQLYPDSSAYNMVTALKITGPLDVDCLQACFDRIINRHSVLTTVFTLKNARPRQKILDVSQLPIECLDWSADNKSMQQIKLDQLLAQETNHVFRLDSLPLIRVQAVKMGPQDHVLVINNHHIMSDGWSQSVFMKEWLSLYQAAILGTQAELPALSVQYVDYAVWQRQLLDSERLEQLLAYWRSTLADMPPALNLPADFVRPAVQTFTAQSETFSLDAGLTSALNQLAEQQHCSVFALLLAGFNLFLARYSGQYDFAVGTPVANRSHQETENLIGFFVNTLVLRNRIEGDPLWLDFLAQVKDTVIDAFAHQELPFEKLVEALQPERDLSNTPFFQAMFLFHNAATQAPRLPGLEIEPLPLASKEVKFDLTLAMHELDGQLIGTFEYNADLFKAERIQIICRGFAHLLKQLAHKPEKRIGDFSIIDDAMYRQVVIDWNRNSAPVPAQNGLYDLFAQRVGSAAEKIALAQGETQLTYQQLSDQVDSLADVLAARGAGPEVLIGVCLKRTPRLIVAMLAILKSGSAYVPLDPDYPSARLEHTLQDANVLLLLTESDLAAAHARLAVVPNILLDRPWSEAGAQSFKPQSPGNLAYVLYTSGSTGKPKGVAITHANAVAMIGWAQSVYRPEQLSRVLVGTSICFDLSVFEIFLTLATGGTLVLLRNVLELAEQPDCAPSLINTVPSAAEELLRVNAIPESVKTVNLAGEPLSAELVNKLYAKAHIEKVYDLYGPSEDTTYSTYCLRQANAQPSIGRPISNSSAYVLDAYLQPLPPGVPGELYLGGMGLARGYHGRPALTAEKFVPNPFGGEAGERLYRTGDLVSYNANGELTYLGRLDHQVKVRGYRIELGEVEAVLKSVAGVDDCVVLTVGETAASDRKLVAYVSASSEHSYTDLEAALMQSAKQQLPRFMVPSAIVMLERLPLTANGKLDRKALPDPELNSVKAAQVLPVGFVQQTLVGIWREILALDQAISVDDDFFELGGHSLLVLDLMTQIKVALGKTLPLAAIFQAPTISALSRLIDKDHQDSEWTPLVPLKTKGDAPPLFCFHPVGGHVICYNELAKALPEDQPVYGLRAPGTESDQAIMTELPEMAAYYLESIKSIQKQGGYRLLGYSSGGLLAYEIARQLEAIGDTVDFVGLLDTAHPELTAQGAAKTDDAELLVSLFPGLGYTAGQLRVLPKPEQLTQIFGKAKQAGLVPRAMDNEAIERYFNVCRSILRMTYRPQKISAPITLIRAQQGSQRITTDDYLAWRQVPGLNMTLHWLSGRHENMMEQPHAGKIAQLIEDVLKITRLKS